MQPQGVRIGERESVHALDRRTGNRREAMRGVVPREQSLCIRQPQCALRRDAELFGIDCGQAEPIVGFDREQNMAIAIAHLDAFTETRQPHAAVGRLRDQVVRPGKRSILLAVLFPHLQFFRARIDPRHASVVTKPQRPVAALAQCPQVFVFEFRRRPVLDRTAGWIDAIDRAASAHDPDAAIAGQRHRLGLDRAERCRILRIVAESAELQRMRNKLRESTALGRQPDAAFAILQHAQHALRPRYRDCVRIRRAVGDCCIAPTQQARHAEPVAAVPIVQDAGDTRIVAVRIPVQCAHAAIRLAQRQSGFCREPDAPVRLGGDCEHQRAGDARRIHAFEVASGPARRAGGSGDPQIAVRIHGQCQHIRIGQAARIVLDRLEIIQRAICCHPVQATAEGAEPQRAIVRGRDREHIVLAHRGRIGMGIATEMQTIGLQRRQALTLDRDPHPVLCIHVQCLHQVAGQRSRIGRIVPPDAEARAVVTRESIVGGEPQIAARILRDCVHRARWQAIGDSVAAEQRRLRRGRVGSGQQPEQAAGHDGAHGSPCGHPRNAASRPQA